MPSLEESDVLEREYTLEGKATLGGAYEILKARWRRGQRDNETALRLLFLAWYAQVEPPFLTGLPAQGKTDELFRQVFTELGGIACPDPDILFAVGHMATLFPWAIGPDDEWRDIGERCLEVAKLLRPEGFPAEYFAGRGTYGHYFAHRVRGQG